jgi:hypothetical protein
MSILRPGAAEVKSQMRVLNAPVNIASLAANNVNEAEEMKSIWVNQREDGLVKFHKILKFYSEIDIL